MPSLNITTRTVYALSEPAQPKRFRYCGSTTIGIVKRLNRALPAARRPGPAAETPVSRWLYQLDRAGVRPVVTVLEELHPSASVRTLRDREAWWTERLLAGGYQLVNARVGDGA